MKTVCKCDQIHGIRGFSVLGVSARLVWPDKRGGEMGLDSLKSAGRDRQEVLKALGSLKLLQFRMYVPIVLFLNWITNI